MSKDVGAPVAQLQWAVTGYMLVGAAVIVTSGALGDVLGRRRVFLARPGAVRRLVRADRALRQRRRHHRRADDPGRRGLDDPRLRDEPPLCGCVGGRRRCGRSRSGAPPRPPEPRGPADRRRPGRPLGGGRACSGSTPRSLPRASPLTLFKVAESRDPNRSKSIDFLGTILIAVILVPLVLALSEGADWGWTSVATIGCLVVTVDRRRCCSSSSRGA